MARRVTTFNRMAISGLLGRSKPRLIEAIFAIGALCVFMPSFVTDFGLHNDYVFLSYDKGSNWFGFNESWHLIAIGRPVGAVLLSLQGLFLNNVHAFAWSRLFAFACVLGVCLAISRTLIDRADAEPLVAAAIAWTFLMSPPSQLYILWSTNLVPGPLNLLAALWTYHFLEKVDPVRLRRGDSKAFLRAAGVVGVLYLSLSIYPPTALFFLGLTFSKVVFARAAAWPKVRGETVRDLKVASCGMGLYFLFNRFVFLPICEALGNAAYRDRLATIRASGVYRFELTANLTEKLGEFVDITKISFGAGLHPIIGNKSALYVGALLLAGCCSLFAIRLCGRNRQSKHDKMLHSDASHLWQRVVTCLAALAWAIAPSLMAARGEVGYRVLPTYEFMVLVVVFALLHWLLRLPSASLAMTRKAQFVLGSFSVAATLFAILNVRDVVRNANRELCYIRGQVRMLTDGTHRDRIVAIFQNRGECYIERPLQLDFSFPITDLVQLCGALKEEAGKLHLNSVGLEMVSPAQGLWAIDEQTLLLDLHNAKLGAHAEDDRSTFEVHTSNNSGGRFLFDSNPATSWSPGSPPAQVELIFRQPIALHHYIITSSSAGDAMPSAWVFSASDNGSDWSEVDAQSGAGNWLPNETRTFQVRTPRSARRYLLRFPASSNSASLRIGKFGLSIN